MIHDGVLVEGADRIKRIAFGFRRFRYHRIRVLLYDGKPNWDLLDTITLGWFPMRRFDPRRNPLENQNAGYPRSPTARGS